MSANNLLKITIQEILKPTKSLAFPWAVISIRSKLCSY